MIGLSDLSQIIPDLGSVPINTHNWVLPCIHHFRPSQYPTPFRNVRRYHPRASWIGSYNGVNRAIESINSCKQFFKYRSVLQGYVCLGWDLVKGDWWAAKTNFLYPGLSSPQFISLHHLSLKCLSLFLTLSWITLILDLSHTMSASPCTPSRPGTR